LSGQSRGQEERCSFSLLVLAGGLEHVLVHKALKLEKVGVIESHRAAVEVELEDGPRMEV